MGELPEAIADGTQESLMASLTSVNIACGGHAGDEQTMKATVEQALRWRLAIGAHPGMRIARISDAGIENAGAGHCRFSYDQVRTLAEVAARCGARLAHVKPHGALYNQAVRHRELAERLPKVSRDGAGTSRWWDWRDRRCWMCFGKQGFGLLPKRLPTGVMSRMEHCRSRKFDDALIHGPGEAGRQALRIAERGTVIAWME